MAKKTKEIKEVKIDIGCGPNPKEGFIGIDKYKMKGVDIVCDVGKDRLPFKDNSVDEVNCTHFLEHLTNFNGKWERTHFFNELHRVMKKGAKASIVFPHWASERYYGDPTHCEPFSEMGFYYLDKDWRATQAPHSDVKWNKNGYSCDFACTWGYSLRQDLLTRNQEYQMAALQKEKGAAQDIIATCTKK